VSRREAILWRSTFEIPGSGTPIGQSSNTHGLGLESRFACWRPLFLLLREGTSLSVARKLWRLRGMFHIRSHPSWSEICECRFGRSRCPHWRSLSVNEYGSGRVKEDLPLTHCTLRDRIRVGAEPVMRGIVPTCSDPFSTTDPRALHASCSRCHCLTPPSPEASPDGSGRDEGVNVEGKLGIRRWLLGRSRGGQIETFGFPPQMNSTQLILEASPN